MHKKEDYVLVAGARRLPIKNSALWDMSVEELKAELGELSAAEDAMVAAAQKARTKYAGKGIEELRQVLRIGEITPPARATRGGLIDIIIRERPRPAVVLDEDQAATVACADDDRALAPLLISAGPGAGKTTTVTHLAARLGTQHRVLVLAYNRVAAKTLNTRLRGAGTRIIPKTDVRRQATKDCGVAVLTFDQYAARVCGNSNDDAIFSRYADDTTDTTETGDASFVESDSYRRAMETAAVALKRDPHCTGHWGCLIVDEAQDVRPTHAVIIAALRTVVPRFVAAGDPRQAIYDGAEWFPELWVTTPAAQRRVLRFNHRSARRIVEVLNRFSRAAFPELHHDQIAVREEAGRFYVAKPRVAPNWPLDPIPSAQELGVYIGSILATAEPGDAYAVAPVTVSKFRLDSAQKRARQCVPELRPGTYAKLASDERGCVDGVYLLATAKKIKGTERGTVVVFGADTDYSVVLTPQMYARLLFVALSRARDELCLVLRPRAQWATNLLDTIIEGADVPFAPAPIMAATACSVVPVMPHISEVDGGKGMLYTVDQLLTRPTLIEELLPKVEDINTSTTFDDDFVTLLVHAAVCKSLGCELINCYNINFETIDPGNRAVSGLSGCVVYRDGVWHATRPDAKRFVFRAGPKQMAIFRAWLESRAAVSNELYDHVYINYTSECGASWEISDRLLNLDITAPAARIGETIRELVGAAADAPCHMLPQLMLSCHGSRPDEPLPTCVSTAGACDLVFNDVPVLLRCTKLTDEHRRGLAIYAAILGVERGLAYNARDGAAEWIPAAPLALVNDATRGLLAIQNGRTYGRKELARYALAPPRELRGASVLIFVDAETSAAEFGAPAFTREIGAVAVRAGDWGVVAVYNRVADDVRFCDATHPNRVDAFTGLTGGSYASGERLEADFRRWAHGVSVLPVFVHWAGKEAALTGDAVTLDGHSRLFHPWLEHGPGGARKTDTKLEDAVEMTITKDENSCLQWHYHRAFDDAIATLAVVGAMIV
jgi:hypothetical protein